MQNSAEKSLINKTAAVLRRSAENAGRYSVLFAASIVLILLSGCTSVNSTYKAVPYGALPGDCLFYFATDPQILPLSDAEGSLRALLKRTDVIYGGVKKGDYYLLFKGSYPDAFAQKRISESPDWEKGEFRKCYYNESRNISLFFAKNNHIFVSNYINTETGEKPINELYNKYMTGPDAVSVTADLFLPEVYFSGSKSGDLFQLYSQKGSGMLSMLPDQNISAEGLEDIEIILREKEGFKDRYSFEGSISFSDEKGAKSFSPVIKLILLDMIRDSNSGISSEDGIRFKLKKENSIIRISDIIISDKVTGVFFNKIIKGQVF